MLLFATPAYCQTHYCGQVLDALLPLVPAYSAKADFVHCEIYESGPTGPQISTVDTWNLPSEPWFFAIDGKGIVRGAPRRGLRSGRDAPGDRRAHDVNRPETTTKPRRSGASIEVGNLS